jgi:hypothetical protein
MRGRLRNRKKRKEAETVKVHKAGDVKYPPGLNNESLFIDFVARVVIVSESAKTLNIVQYRLVQGCTPRNNRLETC